VPSLVNRLRVDAEPAPKIELRAASRGVPRNGVTPKAGPRKTFGE